MAVSFLKKNHKLITILFCVLSIVLMLSSQFIPWFFLDTKKSIGGVADIYLDANFYQSGVDFTGIAVVEAGGFGGLISGIVDLGSVAGDGNITISDEIYYFEGLEQLQGVIGVLYDTSKNADYTVNPQSWSSNNTKVWVNTHTDLIPWWPEGIGQEITITIKLNQTDNVKHIRINEVSIDIYTEWDEADRKYLRKAEEAWKISPGDFLYEEGDEKVYKHPIAIEEEWGDKIGIIAMVDLTMTDNDDQTQYTVVEPFPEDSHPKKIVNIRPISQGQFISIILMFVSLPITVIAAILAFLGMTFTHFEKRRRLHLLFAAGLLEILAVIFFVNGGNTLLNLITFLTEDDYSWNVVGLLIPIIAGVLLFVAFIIELKFGPKKPKEEIKFDISAAMAEEEAAEEEEGFQCPQCDNIFEEFVSTCPECGAEFEGVEEDEEEEVGEEGEGEEEKEEKDADKEDEK